MTLGSRFARNLPFLAALALFFQVGGCAAGARGRGAAASRPAATPAPTTTLDLEPMRIEVGRDPKGATQVSAFDARELFDRAGAALAADRYDEALDLYDRLVAAFPDSKLVPPALFNAGLALEGLGKLDTAIARYLEVVRRSPGTRHGLDAHIRAGAAQAELARWSEALGLFDQILARRDLGHGDRIEVQARRGFVLVESKRYPDAEKSLLAALELAPEAARARQLETDYFVAMARYYLGEIARRQADAVELRLPEMQLQRDLEAKAKYILVAQRRFEDTIRLGNLHWATAAGYQLGAMQQAMWRALVEAPVPRELGSKEAAIYTAEVGALARGHLEKALAAHLMNEKVAAHHRTETPWSQASHQRVAEIHRLLAGKPDAASSATPLRRARQMPPRPAD
jgi:tetratricopeptide (TPR) repeat protein